MNLVRGNWVSAVAILMLVGVFLPIFGVTPSLPYAYYQIMNWVVTIAALLVANKAHEEGSTIWLALFSLVAIIFNPIAPIYLRADIWQITDILAIILFLVSSFLMRSPSRR